jgi:hypothetical protein
MPIISSVITNWHLLIDHHIRLQRGYGIIIAGKINIHPSFEISPLGS